MSAVASNVIRMSVICYHPQFLVRIIRIKVNPNHPQVKVIITILGRSREVVDGAVCRDHASKLIRGFISPLHHHHHNRHHDHDHHHHHHHHHHLYHHHHPHHRQYHHHLHLYRHQSERKLFINFISSQSVMRTIKEWKKIDNGQGSTPCEQSLLPTVKIL